MTNPVYIFGMTNPVTFRLSLESSSVKRRGRRGIKGEAQYVAKTWIKPHVMSKWIKPFSPVFPPVFLLACEKGALIVYGKIKFWPYLD